MKGGTRVPVCGVSRVRITRESEPTTSALKDNKDTKLETHSESQLRNRGLHNTDDGEYQSKTVEYHSIT
jgi:hypothetical protein